MNLLKETLEKLQINGKTELDVKWVGNENYYFTWEEFKIIAKNTEYDSGYGAAEVAMDLIVVGEDFWLERHEYDGSERWEFKENPKKPKEYKVFNKLAGGMWSSLEDLN